MTDEKYNESASDTNKTDLKAEAVRDIAAYTTRATESPTLEGEKNTSELASIYFSTGDISYAPAPDFDNTPDKIKTSRSIFSMTHLSLFVFMIVSQGASILIAWLMQLFMPTEQFVEFASNYTFNIILSNVCQYLLAFPIFLLMTKGIKRSSAVKERKMRFSHLLLVVVIAESFMLSGALISNAFASSLEKLFGNVGDNALDSIVGETPILLLFLTVCVIAPIVEELMFRKVFIDRLSAMGDGVAIFFSALAFGFFHGNIYQILYATAIGFVLGYVYTRTRKIQYTIIIHGVLNFLGSMLPLGVERLTEKFSELSEIVEFGGELALEEELLLSVLAMVINLYELLMYGMILGGIVAFVLLLVKRKIKLRKERDIELSRSLVIETGVCNVGFVMMYAMSLLLILISLIPT